VCMPIIIPRSLNPQNLLNPYDAIKFDFAVVPTMPSVSMQILSPWPSTVIWFFPVLSSFLPAALAGLSYPLTAMSGSSRLRFYTRRKTSESSFLLFVPFSPISCIIDSYSIPYHADVLKGGFRLSFYDGIYVIDC
jgi:hypothetical protein